MICPPAAQGRRRDLGERVLLFLSGITKLETILATRLKKIDDRPFWKRRSFLGENISNANWIVAAILLASGGGAACFGWFIVGGALGVAGLLSYVWNDGVAKTTTIIGGWIAAGAGSAWLLGLLCNAMFGNPAVGYFGGLVIGIVGVVATID